MKRKWILLPISLAFGLLIMFAFQEFTEAQAPGGMPPMSGAMAGRMMTMQILPLETEWAQISFAMDVTDDALIKARKVFADAWKKREAIVAKSESAGDDADARRALRTELEGIKSSLDAELKKILNPKQIEALAKWEKENQNRFRQRSTGGGPGGGRPGGGRPQR